MIHVSRLVRMLSLEVALDDWFHRMTRVEQKAYVKAHPRSKYARAAGLARPTTRRALPSLPPKRPVRKAAPAVVPDAPAAPTRGTYADHARVMVGDTQRPNVSRAWNGIFHKAPVKYQDALVKGTGLTARGRLRMHGGDGVKVTTDGHGKDGHRVFNAERTFAREWQDDGTKPLVVDHHMFEVADHHQGHHLGKAFLKNSMREYHQMGVHHVKTQANLDVGGYAWAKYGFHPKTVDDWHELRGQVRENFSKIRPHLDPKTRTHVEKLLKSNDPKTAWDLADLNEPVESVGHASDGRVNTVGKHLMIGTDWKGHLPLHDEQAMRRFNAYVS